MIIDIECPVCGQLYEYEAKEPKVLDFRCECGYHEITGVNEQAHTGRNKDKQGTVQK